MKGNKKKTQERRGNGDGDGSDSDDGQRNRKNDRGSNGAVDRRRKAAAEKIPTASSVTYKDGLSTDELERMENLRSFRRLEAEIKGRSMAPQREEIERRLVKLFSTSTKWAPATNNEIKTPT